LAVWALGGAVALIGAFCFGELGDRIPKAGGGYVYLRDAFGPLPAFLYAWALLLVIATGAIAAVAVTFANYTVALLGVSERLTTPLAIGAILLLSAINYVGVKPGAVTQNIFTILKLVAIAGLVVTGLAFAGAGTGHATVESLQPPEVPHGFVGVGVAIASALSPVLFAYGGWQQTNYIAEEIIDVRRNLPRALVLGVVVVVVSYLLVNITYLTTLSAPGLAASTAPAADAMRAVFGATGAGLISAGIAISTFGFLNLVILVTPRVYQTMASDGLFFPAIARLHPKHRTPTVAITFQAAWAILLTVSGTYGELLDYVVFGDWVFFGLTVATLFVYRARDRAAGTDPTPQDRFRVPGYPLIPGLFVMTAVYVVAGSIETNPGNAARGAALLALGVPVFYFWKRRVAKKVRSEE
ncbi:MAG: amino acid permease, partial [Gemmatimonadales bacterium]|nr:amino acid permease [Gemmatimonadales bacterium]